MQLSREWTHSGVTSERTEYLFRVYALIIDNAAAGNVRNVF